MLPGRGGGDPSPGRAHEQALADEEGLVDVLDGLGGLGHADGERREPDRATAEPLAEGGEDRPVDLVEAALVDAEHAQALAGGVGVDGAAPPHLGEVPDPAQQPVGDAGRAPGPAGDLTGALGRDLDVEDAGGSQHDGLEVDGLVVVEPGDEPEPVAQRTGDEAGAGGGAHERERRDVEPDRAGGGALAEDDVELEVLHRRIEHLLDRPGQAVDLVDEEHVAVAQLREDRRQVARPLQRRART